jgi:RNA polymerase sigma-70 factor (ECF subfamily)
MYAVGEYKHREIAEFLHMPLGTVTWKYNNALKKMRKALEENQTQYEREQAKAKI